MTSSLIRARGALVVLTPAVLALVHREGLLRDELEPLAYERLNDAEISHFSEDGEALCYEGPTALMRNMYINVKDSWQAHAFQDSELRAGRCSVDGFINKVGNSCWGDVCTSYPRDDFDKLSPDHEARVSASRARYQEEHDTWDNDKADSKCLADMTKMPPMSYWSVPAEEQVNFGPRDGIICYQGPREKTTRIFEATGRSNMRFIFEDSVLYNGTCISRGFRKSMGHTCVGDGYMNTWNLQPHTHDEDWSHKRYEREVGSPQDAELCVLADRAANAK